MLVKKNIPVINIVSEREVKLIEDYTKKTTKDDLQKQYLLQVVSGYYKKYYDHKKVTLTYLYI